MYQIIIKDNGDYIIPISLTANTIIEGTYIDAENAIAPPVNIVDKINSTISNVVNNELNGEIINMSITDIKNYFNTVDYFVTGTTDSKYNTILKSYVNLSVLSSVTETYGVNSIPPVKELNNSDIVGRKILINGTDIYAMILRNDTVKEYALYINTKHPIKYIDFPDGVTTFKYKAAPDYEVMNGKILYYNRLIDEPKILSEVFIDRGVNNVFEPVKRLKNIDNLKELMKVGLGYYKINSTGFNFKNTK